MELRRNGPEGLQRVDENPAFFEFTSRFAKAVFEFRAAAFVKDDGDFFIEVRKLLEDVYDGLVDGFDICRLARKLPHDMEKRGVQRILRRHAFDFNGQHSDGVGWIERDYCNTDSLMWHKMDGLSNKQMDFQ